MADERAFEYFVDYHTHWLDHAYRVGIDRYRICCGINEGDWKPPADRDLSDDELVEFLRRSIWQVSEPYVAAVDWELRAIDVERARREWRHAVDIDMAGAWAEAAPEFSSDVENAAVRRFLRTHFPGDDDTVDELFAGFCANRTLRPVIG